MGILAYVNMEWLRLQLDAYTLVLWWVSSNRWELKRVPLRYTVSLGSGPDGEGFEVRERAFNCSSRERTIPSPCSSVKSRVWREQSKIIPSATFSSQHKLSGNFPCVPGACEQTLPQYLFQKWYMTATLSEAQQERQDMDCAGRLLWLGTGQSMVSLGHSKLLSNYSIKTHSKVFNQIYIVIGRDYDRMV